MAASSPYPMAYLFLLLLPYFPIITTLSQDPSPPDIIQCRSHLLTLVPCAPFVQGMIPTPAQPCCDNLKQVYNDQPACLCLLLNNTNLSSFPINTTRALQLPLLCNLKVGFSTCSGGNPPSIAPASSQVSFGARNGSIYAASPVITVAPRPTIMGLGIKQNGDASLNRDVHWMIVVAAALLSIAII